MNDLGLSLLGGAVRVTALALFGLVIALALKRRGPSAVVLATFSTLSSLLVVTLLSLLPWPRFWGVDWGARTARAAQGTHEQAGRAVPHAAALGDAASRSGFADTRLADFAAEFVRGLGNLGEAPAAAGAGAFSGWRWPAWVSLGLLTGVGLGLARLAFGVRSVACLRRRSAVILDPAVVEEVDCLRAALGCVAPVELRESVALTTAATVGWRRPVVLLPAGWRGWTDEERRAALAHELAHVRAGDYGSGLWAQLCLCMHIYHPLAHWLVARLRLEQELAADALAARVSGGSRPYLESLARLALRRPGPVESRPMAALWPARPFLPTRGTLLRRIEMLRDPNLNPTRTDPLPWVARVSTIAALAVAGLALVGLRGPASAQAQQAKERPRAQQAQGGPSDVFDLSHAPAETVLAIAGTPAALLTRPEFKSVADLLSPQGNSMFSALGLRLDEVESVVVLMMRGFLAAPPPGGTMGASLSFTIRTTRPLDWQKIETALAAEPERANVDGVEIVRSKATQSAFAKFDDRTLAVGPEAVLRQVIAARKGGPIKHAWDGPWSKVKKGQAGVAVDASAFAPLFPKNAPPGQMTALTAAAGPLVEKASAYGLGIDLEKGLSLDLVAVASSDEAAKEVADTLKALAVLGTNALDTLRRQTPANEGKGRVMLTMLDVIEPLLKNAKTEVDGSVVELRSATDQNVAGLIAPLAPAIVAARAAGRNAQSMNNTRQIALAMHNYYSANNHFPPAVLLGTDGKTPYSWRVALLPYLAQPELYNQYHFNEPWDSAANRLVLAKMPAVYRHPSAGPNEVDTAYVVPVNAGSIFPPRGAGTKFEEIPDGTSNTIMLVEAKSGIPWTKPEDLTIGGDLMQGDTPAPKVPAYSDDGFIVALGDGSVRFLPSTTSPAVLKAIVTRAGGEVIDWLKVLDPSSGQPRPSVPKPLK
ncbi:MAG: M56 family metallopeptidase [Isosphaeraceae bacterium]|nr:M56 family metallopeptidase [Isosphaeraceae bacterium]